MLEIVPYAEARAESPRRVGYGQQALLWTASRLVCKSELDRDRCASQCELVIMGIVGTIALDGCASVRRKAGRGRVRLPICANAEGEVRVFVNQEALSATLVEYTECDGCNEVG